jgi:hypothetical protein
MSDSFVVDARLDDTDEVITYMTLFGLAYLRGCGLTYSYVSISLKHWFLLLR